MRLRRSGIGLTLGFVLLIGGLTAPTQAASVVDFNDFSDLSAFTLNGVTDTIHSNNPDLTEGGQQVLRLTNDGNQGGSAFLTDTITLANNASFSTFFSFQITDSEGISDSDGPGADGLVFVVQTEDDTAGGVGAGIGYSGIDNSVGVEFDTFANGSSPAEPNGNHVGIDLNGSTSSEVAETVADRLNNGTIRYAWVDYNGQTDLLEVRLSKSPNRPTAPLLTHTVDLVQVLGQTDAFVGFTSGTGSASNDHDIRSWTFTGQFAPIGTDPSAVPTPTALAGGLVLLGGLTLRRRRRRS